MEFVLSFIALISLGTDVFLLGRVAKTISPLLSLFLFQLIGIPFFLLFLPFGTWQVTTLEFMKIVALGAYQTFVMLMFMHAMKVGVVSIVSSLGNLYVLGVAFLGVVILGESWSYAKGLAIALIALGGILVSFHVTDISGRKKFSLLKGVVPASFAAVGTSIYLFFVSGLVRQNGWFIVAFGIRVAFSFVCAVLLFVRKEKITAMFPVVPWRWVVPAALLDVVGFSFYNIAIITGEISYVTAVVSAQSLVIAVLSYAFLKERLRGRQIAGILVIVVGLVSLQLIQPAR